MVNILWVEKALLWLMEVLYNGGWDEESIMTVLLVKNSKILKISNKVIDFKNN